MKVIGWTGWDDPRYPDDYGDDPLLEERKKVVVEELLLLLHVLPGPLTPSIPSPPQAGIPFMLTPGLCPHVNPPAMLGSR